MIKKARAHLLARLGVGRRSELSALLWVDVLRAKVLVLVVGPVEAVDHDLDLGEEPRGEGAGAAAFEKLEQI